MHLDGVSVILVSHSNSLYQQQQSFCCCCCTLAYFSTKTNSMYSTIETLIIIIINAPLLVLEKNAATALYTWFNPRRDAGVYGTSAVLHTLLFIFLLLINRHAHICRVEEKKNCFSLFGWYYGRDMEVCVPAATTFGWRVNHFQLQLKFVWILQHSSLVVVFYLGGHASSGAVTRRMRVTTTDYFAFSSAGGIFCLPYSVNKKTKRNSRDFLTRVFILKFVCCGY